MIPSLLYLLRCCPAGVVWGAGGITSLRADCCMSEEVTPCTYVVEGTVASMLSSGSDGDDKRKRRTERIVSSLSDCLFLEEWAKKGS